MRLSLNIHTLLIKKLSTFTIIRSRQAMLQNHHRGTTAVQVSCHRLKFCQRRPEALRIVVTRLSINSGQPSD